MHARTRTTSRMQTVGLHQQRPLQFDTWLDDLQLYLLSDSRDSVLLFNHTFGAAPAPPATVDSATRSQWLTRDAAARLAIRNHPLDHFLSLDPTSLTVDLLDQHLLAAETSAVAIGAARGTPRTPFFEGCSPSPLAPSYASAAAVDVLSTEDVRAAYASAKRRSSKGKGGRSGGGGSGSGGGGSSGGSGGSGGSRGGGSGGSGGGSGSLVVAVEAAVGVAVVAAVAVVAVGLELSVEVLEEASGSGSSVEARHRRPSSFVSGCFSVGRMGVSTVASPVIDNVWRAEFGDEVECPHWAELLRSGVAIFDLDYDAIIFAMYALSASAEGDCYRCVPPDPGIEAAALVASESSLPGTAPAEALHTFTLDSGSSRCQVAPPCSCRLQSHQTLLWQGHPSLPCLRGMHSRLLVSGLPRSLPPIPPLPAPPYLPCVEGRQRATPNSSSFPPTTAPLQTLHMDVWGPARVSGQGRERYFLLVVDDYTRYTSIFPLRSKIHVVDVLIPWIRAVRLQLRERFRADLPVLRMHSDRGGEFSSDLLRDFCCGEGILLSFTLPESPQKNGIAERHIGLVMEVARTSMIHAAAPHFLWPFAVQYAAHQLNLWPRVSLPETLCTLRWTGKVGDASVFRLWGSFLPPHLASCLSLSGHHTPSPQRVLLPLPDTAPIEVAVGSGATSGGAASGGAEPGGAESGGVESGGAEPGGTESAGVEPRGAEPEGVEPGGAESEGAESRGAEPRGGALSRGPAGASPRLSLQQLREWFVRQARLRRVATEAGGAGDAGAGGARVTAGTGGTGGTAAAGPGGARTMGTGAAVTDGVGAAGAGDPTEPGGAVARGVGDPTEPRAARDGGAGDPTEPGAAGAGGIGAGGAGAGGAGAGGTGNGGAGAGRAGALDPGGTSQLPLQSASPLPAPSPYTEKSSGLTEHRAPTSRPASPVRTARRVPRSRTPPVPGTYAIALRPSSVPLRVPWPAPLESSLPEVLDPESDHARAASPAVSRLLATVVTDPSFESAAASALVAELLDFAAACHLDYVTALVAESESVSPPSVAGECALGTDVLEDRQVDLECLAAAVPRFASMLPAPEGDPDAPDIPTPRSNAEAITGFTQRQGVDYFQTFSPTPKMTTLRVLLHVAAQRDYELHSLDFSTAFLQGNLHEEIWQRRPLGFTELFPAGTQWRLRRPVYGLRQAPQEWHDTLRTTLTALGFTPSTADPLLFLRIHTSLPLFYVLVYVYDLVFTTADTEALTLVKSELQKRHTCTELGEVHIYLGLQITRNKARCTITLAQSHMVHQVLQRFGFQFSSLSAPPSDESVEPSGLYPELVGCLMYLMTCTRPDLAYPLSHLARYVAPDASWVDDSATQRSSQGYTFSLGSGSVSWRSTRSSSVLSSSCEAAIYAGAMAAQKLRWLTYLLTNLGEQPRSPPQSGQLRLAYVSTRANTADIFTKALPTGDHQRFSTVLGLVPTLPHLLIA
ncbi:unnamed protein product [Closterium sp. NIES-53]